MPTLRSTRVFSEWLSALRDYRAKDRIAARLRRLEDGNAGQVRSVGDGVAELKIDYGPGYRVYFTRRGFEVILLLCGGDKGTQSRDIETAKALAREYREANDGT